MLRVILNDKNKSLYQLEKTSHISHATLNDIYNEKYNIDKCSISLISKMADALDMSIDSLYKCLSYNDLSLITYNEDFDLFKSNTLQRLKATNEKEFINNLVDNNTVESLFDKKDYLKSLYLVSLIDYLSKNNNEELLERYNEIRKTKLDRLYVPKSVYLLLATKTIKITKIFKESITTFLDHNIVEAEIDNVA